MASLHVICGLPPPQTKILALPMQCWYSYLMLFQEEDIYDLESCIRVTLNFFNFFVICYLKEKLYHFSMYCQIKSRSV